MPDETTGALPAEETPQQTESSDAPASFSTGSANGVATPAALTADGPDAPAADAAALSVDAPEENGAQEIEEMPPLDQIEVPGGGGGNDRGGRGRRNDRFDGGATRELSAGDVVTGTVVHIDSDGVLVDVGTKTEGLVRPNELSREPITNVEDVVKVGDRIEVLVIDPAGKDGNLLLSKKRADFEKAWDRVQEALESGASIQAMVSDRVKGGLVVDLGIRGFVPASHVGNGKLKNLEKFVGQSVPLKVLEVDREHRKVVLSHRLATEEERAKQKDETIGSLGEGQVRTGVVRRVTDYGAFVDLGGIDGLLHVSEMSWTRVKHPSDVVKVGDELQVMVLKLAAPAVTINGDEDMGGYGDRGTTPLLSRAALAKITIATRIKRTRAMGEALRILPPPGPQRHWPDRGGAPSSSGFCYLAALVDGFPRFWVGWHLSRDIDRA